MLKTNFRYINFYEIRINSKPKEAPEIAMNDIITFTQSLITKKSSGLVKMIKKNSAAIRLKELKIDRRNNLATLLVILSDQNITDPAFSDLQTGSLRVEKKLAGEGIAVSAHITMSLESNDKGGYLMLAESVPGITASRISSFLNTEICRKFKKNFHDGGPKEKKYRPHVEILEHPNETLRQALTGGELRGIELVSHTSKEPGLDEEGITYESTKSMKIKEIDKNAPVKRALNYIKKLADIGRKKKYDEIKVRFKPHDARAKTITIPTASQSIEDSPFVRADLIEFSSELPQCSESINSRISKKLTEKMKLELGEE